MEEGAEAAAPERKSEWTSLEKAKLIASCATPLLIFMFGLIVAANIRNDETQRRKGETEAAQVREDRAAQQAAARLAADRQATALREAAQREEARKDAREASLIAFQREQVLIDRSAAREEAQRVRERREARTDKILDKRKEIWAEAGPLIANVRWRLYDLEVDRDEMTDEDRASMIKEVKLDLSKVGDSIATYQSYFSDQFIEAFDAFSYSAQIMSLNVDNPTLTPEYRDKFANNVHISYRALIALAIEDLAHIEGGPAEIAWDFARGPTSLDEPPLPYSK